MSVLAETDVFDPADLDFWMPENWPGERAPARIEVKPTGRALSGFYSEEDAGRPEFRGLVEVWVPEWLRVYYRDHEGVVGGTQLWWSSGGSGTAEHATAWCYREAAELEALRDRELERVRAALRQAPTVARLRGLSTR